MTEENLPAVPAATVHSLQMPVSEFEGEMVRIMRAKVPSVDLIMDYGYRRGTHIKVELELEIIGVGHDEAKSDSKDFGWKKGDLIRDHKLALREAKVLGVYSAEEADPGVGGSLAASGADIEDEEAHGQEETDGRPEGPEHEGAEDGAADAGPDAGNGADDDGRSDPWEPDF